LKDHPLLFIVSHLLFLSGWAVSGGFLLIGPTLPGSFQTPLIKMRKLELEPPSYLLYPMFLSTSNPKKNLRWR
jgi:hypothetical protein